MQLYQYCTNVREVLKTAVQGRRGDSLDESVKVALEDLGRCADQSHSVCFFNMQHQGNRRNRVDAQEGSEHATH